MERAHGRRPPPDREPLAEDDGPLGARRHLDRLGRLGPYLVPALCWGLAGATAIWALIRLFGLESGYPLLPLIAYTPYAAVGSILVAGLCAGLRRWPAAALAGTAALYLALAILPRALPGPAPEGDPSGPHIRVMTSNMRIGKGDPEQIVDLVRDRDIDALSVQEMTDKGRAALEAAGLRKLLPRFVYGPTVDGNASALYTRLPAQPFPPDPDAAAPLPRAILTAPGGERFDLMGVHPFVPNGGTTVGWWRDGFDQIPRAGDGGDEIPKVIAGDFNATLDSAPMRDLIGSGYHDAADVRGAGLRPTFPAMGSKSLPVTIDHVLVDRRIGVDGYDLEEIRRSDHRAVIVELTLP